MTFAVGARGPSEDAALSSLIVESLASPLLSHLLRVILFRVIFEVFIIIFLILVFLHLIHLVLELLVIQAGIFFLLRLFTRGGTRRDG
jgi:hypothetical protein